MASEIDRYKREFSSGGTDNDVSMSQVNNVYK